MADPQPVFQDDQALPPDLPETLLDEEPRQEPPGSFLSALPQFFVFPAILVLTLTAVYLLLRVLAGSTPDNVPELLADLEAAGPKGRWQVLNSLATGLGNGSLNLDEVSADELERLYSKYEREGSSPAERARMSEYLLRVVARKQDPRFTGKALEALASSDQALSQAGFEALGLLGDPAAVPALLNRLRGSDPNQRLLALGALSQIDDPEALSALSESLRSEDSVVARNAVLLLARAPHQDASVKPFLLRMLNRQGYADDPTLDGPLRELMDDASREAARDHAVNVFLVMACQAASELGDLDAVPPLENLREADPSLKVRSAAIDALHELGSS